MTILQFFAGVVWVIDVVLFIRIVEVHYIDQDMYRDRLDAIKKGLI